MKETYIKIFKKGRPIVGVSGGKDSTATCLHLLYNLGLSKNDFDRVFIDTGWENEKTYHYIESLESIIGPIIKIKAEISLKKHQKEIEYFEKKLGYESPMIRMIFKNMNFPRNFIRWCTRELKLKPLKKYFDSLDYDVLNVNGIRSEESLKRSKMNSFDWSDYLNCYTWRPLLQWTEKQVIEIHQKYNVIPNELYLNNHDRVGCYPCIHSRKKDIKNLPVARIEFIDELEQAINKIRKENDKSPCGFFTSRNQDLKSIKDFYKWALTSHGGKQYFLFDSNPQSCMKWGLCDYKRK